MQISQMGVSAASVVIATMAAPVISVPRIGNIRYRPVRVISMPERIEVPMSPTIMGSISKPDAAAEVPDDICRNVGTNPIAANIPRPMVRPIAVALTKIGLRNSDSGMIGSFAFASTSTKPNIRRTKVRRIKSRLPIALAQRSLGGRPRTSRGDRDAARDESAAVGGVRPCGADGAAHL